MPSTSGRINRRQKLSRELIHLANSPGWIAATEKVLKTPGSELRGRRTSIIPPGYSPPKTRRRTIVPNAKMLPFPPAELSDSPLNSRDNKDRSQREKLPSHRKKSDFQSKLIEVSEDTSEVDENTSGKLNNEVLFKSKLSSKQDSETNRQYHRTSTQLKLVRMDEKKTGKGSRVGRERMSVNHKQPISDMEIESRSSKRRNTRLRPYSKRGDTAKGTIEEDEQLESPIVPVVLLKNFDPKCRLLRINGENFQKTGDGSTYEECIKTVPTETISDTTENFGRGGENMNDAEETQEAEALQSSVAENSFDGSEIDEESGNRCSIL